MRLPSVTVQEGQSLCFFTYATMKDLTVGVKLLLTTGQKWRCQHLCSLQYYKDNLRIVFHIFTEKHRPGGIVQS